ncbi:MAG: hypothetical protein ACRDUA_13930 [Micromonosporaceae bacterium]
MAEIRRQISDLVAMVDRMARPGPFGSRPSPDAALLYAELSRLAAAVQDISGRDSTVVTTRRGVEPRPAGAFLVPRTRTAPHRRSSPGPLPSATDYWFG